jgi:two-component system, NtrC family, response regulator AtoC
MHKILIVDDEKNMRWAIKRAFKNQPYRFIEATNGEEGLIAFEKEQPDLVLLDLKMPKVDGLTALERMKKLEKELEKDIPVVMITAHGTTETAVEAMKLGALDYISKPFDVEELRIILRKALEFKGLQEKLNSLEEALELKQGKPIIGKSEKMNEVYKMVNQVAKTDATVLILGESGTGKEIIADTIHRNSERHQGPYIKVNCGAIPENLLESELFGYEKGAFTGAVKRKVGKFQRAEGGTIFLDEIGELSLNMQVKILRVLQEREVEPVGGLETHPVDLRIITATNQNLYEKVKNQEFREDLYYRLNVFPIELPPLRERKEDIPLLVAHFLEKYQQELGKKEMKISDEALTALKDYPWPGNIRELENIIERTLIISSSKLIETRDLPPGLLKPYESDSKSFGKNTFLLPEEGIDLETLEKDLILQALERTADNQTRAARLLGISRHTLLYRMEKYQLKK